MNTVNRIYGEVVNKVIEHYIEDNSVILDVGCGTGELAELVKKRGCRIYGVDSSEEAVKKAKNRFIDIIQNDIETINSLPWEERFDIIILADVLEHLKNPLNVLIKLKEYLKDNGKFLISLPNICFWRTRLDILFGRFEYSSKGGIMDENHLRFFTFGSAKRLIKDAGLNILKFDIPAPTSYTTFFSLKIKYKIKKVLPTLLSHGIFIVAGKS